MKKIIFLVLIGIIIPNANAQSDSQRKFGLGIFYSMDQNKSSKSWSFNNYTGYSAKYDKPNFKIGLLTEYKLNKSLSIESGVQYSDKDFTGTFYCEVCDFITVPSPEKIDLTFLEIPVSVQYYFLPGKTKIYTDIGLINQFALKNSIIEKNYIISGKTGLGLEYNLDERFAFQLGLEYNQGLTKMLPDPDFKFKTISINFSILHKI